MTEPSVKPAWHGWTLDSSRVSHTSRMSFGSPSVTIWTIVTVYVHSVHVRGLAVPVFFSLEGTDRSDKPGRWPPLLERSVPSNEKKTGTASPRTCTE